MHRDAVFDAIADERRLLADVLADLDEDAWATPSLCAGWTVRDVAAHLLMPLVTPTPVVVGTLIRNRGDIDRTNTAMTRRTRARYGGELPEWLRDNAGHRFTPPLTGPEAPLTDLLIHGQDIRRPLGRTRSFDRARLTTALDFLASPAARFFSPSRARVRWVVTDLDRSDGPTGAPEVVGPAEAILLARTGRTAVLGDLSGDGVALLGHDR